MYDIWSLAPWVAALFISAVFLDSLRFKFTGHRTTRHIFETLREWSKIELFYPVGPWVIGAGELLSSLLLIAIPAGLSIFGGDAYIGLSQFAGALLALGIMTGAIGFHLFTPLGLETPVKWSGDIIVASSKALFITACATWASAAFIVFLRWNAVAGAGL